MKNCISVEGLQFVDTNILVYAHDITAGEKRKIAIYLLNNLWETRNGCLSVQVLQEFYVTVTQKIVKPIESEEASRIISALSAWKVDTPTAVDVLSAIQLQHKHQVSFWDAIILQSAQALNCKILWSEDLAPYAYDDVSILNPFQIAYSLIKS